MLAVKKCARTWGSFVQLVVLQNVKGFVDNQAKEQKYF